MSTARRVVAALKARAPHPRLEVADLFPPLEVELADHLHLFTGRTLNAGAGHRDLAPFIAGEIVNQDIEEGLHNANIHVYAPLDAIPFPDGDFDAVICNAVLEHVERPEAVMKEFARIIRPGGILYLGVPFMQPEHLDPTDFQRYTVDGLSTLARTHGFDVTEATPLHSVYTTLGWIAIEWLRPMRGLRGWALRWALWPWLRRRAVSSKTQVHSLASGYRVVAVRRG